MKCPKDRGMLVEIKVYGTTYLMCKGCNEGWEGTSKNSYWEVDTDNEGNDYIVAEIEDIAEYKNEIRRKALKKLLGFTEVHEDQD